MSSHNKPKPTLSELECCDAPPPTPKPEKKNTAAAFTFTFQELKTYCTRAAPILLKLLTLATFLLATLALWPSIESAADTKTSTGLAEWTSRKEFIEFCEGHQWRGDSCEKVKGYELGSPPGFWGRLRVRRWRRSESYMKWRGGEMNGVPMGEAPGLAGATASSVVKGSKVMTSTVMPTRTTEAVVPGGMREGESEVDECPNELFLARRILLGRRACQSEVERRREGEE
ncbi:hypothetical protein QBC38DRAFT_39815 [Podospora fimiseda]|uniref:Uncharacterized protein n=1 Tax=Podospora fimiseda TaxID=252190 RepID=A0AAN7BVF1_9PEZI|nr:hypothetical protein QBC38DRAFT_39815 [Podospora fimiseda]